MHEFALDKQKIEPILDGLSAPVAAKGLAGKINPIFKSTELLKKLDGFCRDHQNLAVVMGARSSGKTTLLKYIQSENRQTIFYIQASPKINLYALLSNNLLGLDENSDVPGKIDSLLKVVSNAYQKFILIIDDAETLSLENFQTVVQAFGKHSPDNLKLILAGDLMLSKRLEELAKQDSCINAVHFRLEPFSSKETEKYLKKYLCPLMGWQVKSFSNKNIKLIHKLSEGYLGRINRIAMQYAIPMQKAPTKKSKSAIDILLTVAILLLLSVIIFRISTFVNNGKIHFINMPHLPRTTASLKTEPVNAIIYPEVNFDIANMPSYIASIEGLPEEHFYLEKDLPLDLPLPHYMKNKGQKSAATQINKGYTLQLLTAHKKQTLINWKQHLNLSELKIIYPEKEVGWYVLTYGHFASLEEAQKALNHLPKEVKNQKPLIRTVSF